MNILVLGGGQQGRVIATDLARSLPTAVIDVADVRDPRLPELPNLRFVEADGADVEGDRSAASLDCGPLPLRESAGSRNSAQVQARLEHVWMG